MFDLSGKVAMVTGASSGIGAVIAQSLAQQGAKVILTARRVDKLNSLSNDLNSQGYSTLAIKMDVNNKQEIELAVSSCIKHFGRLDILINNAGVVGFASLLEMKEEQWDQVLDTNLKGYFLVAQAVSSEMIKNKWGRIINISSIAMGGQGVGFPMIAHYCASKAGIVGLTESMAQELAPMGILVNCISPGLIESEMTEGITSDKKTLDGYLTKIPLKRVGKPEEIAALAVYLSSDESSYTTGSTIVVDGGWLSQICQFGIVEIMKFVYSLKNHKLVITLFLVIVVLLFQKFQSKLIPQPLLYQGVADSMSLNKSMMEIAPSEFAPQEEVNRLVAKESNISLVVSKVSQSVEKIIDYTRSINGYMVNTSLTSPQESPFATVVLRVPSSSLDQSLEFFRSLSIKVSSENIVGDDLTDEYFDIEERLTTLNFTKDKFESILKQTSIVADILTVQREIINLQSQIDEIKGRKEYLEKSAQLAKITIYLSTDELSLPYAPTERFRPIVIIKQAIKSLLQNVQQLMGFLIWVAVYSVVWIPILILVILLYKFFSQKK